MKGRKKQYVAPILVTLIMVIYYVVYFALLFTVIGGIWKWILGVIPFFFAVVMIKVCIERINEIKKGENDDLSKY